MTRLRFVVIVIVVSGAFALLIRLDGRAPQSQQQTTNTAQSFGVGNWVSDTGDILQLRRDGTGHSRHLHGGELHDCEFEWSCDGKLLTITNFPNVLGSFMAHETGLATATFPVVEATDESFMFRHDGVVVKLNPANGNEMPTNGLSNGG